MSVFIDKNTKVMVQGITGSTALFHTNKCLIMIVAGNTRVKVDKLLKVYLYIILLLKLKKKQGANVSVVYVPAPFAQILFWKQQMQI